MEGIGRSDRIAAIAALSDPTPNALYSFVAHSPDPVTVDEAARATGTPKSTAALQLTRLAEVGVLTVAFERRSGRTGPGAGRPAKVYRPARDEILASIPGRDYELLGEVFAGALETADAAGVPVAEAVRRVAAARGASIMAQHPDIDHALTAVGYDPSTDDAGLVTLTNCPFHHLAAGHTDLVCRANLALVGAMASSVGGCDAVLDPAPGRCCVVLVPNAGGSAR
ncbi:MAG: helix-turn-helix domain-containing protein [Pseudolysinimonas sp.]